MEGITTALTTAFGTSVTACQGVLSDILPVGMGLITAMLVVRFAIKAFKMLGNKA